MGFKRPQVRLLSLGPKSGSPFRGCPILLCVGESKLRPPNAKRFLIRGRHAAARRSRSGRRFDSCHSDQKKRSAKADRFFCFVRERSNLRPPNATAFFDPWPPCGRPAKPERPQIRLLSLRPRKLRIAAPVRMALFFWKMRRYCGIIAFSIRGIQSALKRRKP